jgi:hypothetical protein
MPKVYPSVHSDRVMSSVEAAYFAGFADGEGSFTTTRTARENSRSGFRYQPVFRVVQCDLAVLEWLWKICGNGRIVTQTKPMSVNHRLLYALTFSPNQIRHVLPQLIPYLRVKLKPANLLMEFLSISQGWHIHQRPVDWQRLEAIHREIHNLNVRGVDNVEMEEPISVRPSRSGNNQWTKKTSESA